MKTPWLALFLFCPLVARAIGEDEFTEIEIEGQIPVRDPEPVSDFKRFAWLSPPRSINRRPLRRKRRTPP